MKKTQFICLLLALLIWLPSLGSLAESEPPVSYVLNPNPTDRLNLRKEASTSSEAIARYYTGTVVEVLGITGEFTHVRVGDLVGYMQSSFLSYSREDLEVGSWGIVNNPKSDEKLNLRAAAQSDALIYEQFSNGSTVQVLGEEEGYYKVRTHDLEGYMIKDYVQLDGEDGKPIMTKLTVGQLESDGVVLRAFPSDDALSLGTHSILSQVTILDVVGVWYYVEVSGPSGWASEAQRGFMPARAIRVGNFGSGTASSQRYAVIRTPDDRERFVLRAESTWSSDLLGIYYNATQMLVLDDIPMDDGPKPTWVHVIVGDQEGYIQGQYIDWVLTTDPSTW